MRDRSSDSTPTYWYTGNCPQSDRLLQLPRTREIESIARQLMTDLAQDPKYAREGKMFGVMLVKTKSGTTEVIKAFSGLLNGESIEPGWVPPIPGRDRVKTIEAQTLADLAAIKQELIELDPSPIQEQYRLLAAEFSDRLELLTIEHRRRKDLREQQRSRTDLDDTGRQQLAEQSRADGRERRHLKQERDRVLHPFEAILAQAIARIRELKQQRKTKSRQLQVQMHDAYRLMNFLGTARSLRELMPAGIPTGTGECCAPKLLHYAATHQLTPIAMAEFWWGENTEDKRLGEFYEACLDRCQPLMGFMLSGIAPPPASTAGCSVPIVYEDEYLIAVNKPTELLSVPGRYFANQDSVLTRLRQLFGDEGIYPVHRLDFETSGILLFARDKQTCSYLNQQFRTRQVQKVYEAILSGKIDTEGKPFGCEQGSIELPLAKDPNLRLAQKVDFHQGKPSLTKFQVLAQIGDYTRIEFMPITGRTHQLRIHSAAAQGLGVPILGDRLYGCQAPVNRLHLHAREISFVNFDRFTGNNRLENCQQEIELIHLSVKAPF